MSQVNSYDREQYATDGVTKTFSFGWDVNSTDDVKVNFVRDDGTILDVGTFINSDDQEYTTSNFSFVVELNRQGGTITFADTPADDQNIIIWRETELVYENSFKTATAFPAAAIDKAYRKIWLALQEVQSDVIHNTVRMTPNQRGLHFGEFSEDVTDRLVYYNDPNKELLFTPFTVSEVQNTIAIAQNIPSIAGDAAEALSRATAALTIANQAKSEAQIARQDAATAIQTANNIDAKAQTALDNSVTAINIANRAYATYIHDQAIAASVWTINHNLDKYPSITVVDTGGNVILGKYTYTDTNTLVAEFNAAFKGTAYLN